GAVDVPVTGFLDVTDSRNRTTHRVRAVTRIETFRVLAVTPVVDVADPSGVSAQATRALNLTTHGAAAVATILARLTWIQRTVPAVRSCCDGSDTKDVVGRRTRDIDVLLRIERHRERGSEAVGIAADDLLGNQLGLVRR